MRALEWVGKLGESAAGKIRTKALGCRPRSPKGLPPVAVQGYLRACFAQESPPRVSELACQLRVSRGWLDRQFMLLWGVTPSTYLKDRQLERAMSLLRDSSLPGKRVGYQAAFGTRRTFFRSFHAHAGITPAGFREAWREREFLKGTLASAGKPCPTARR